MSIEPRNRDFAARVRDSFVRQTFMGTIGAVLDEVVPGSVTVRLPTRADLLQQHGFFHGGLVGTIADNAGGYSAFSMMRAEDSVLTVEYKLNIMAPATGDALIAIGQVIRAGKTLTVCRSDVYGVINGERKHCASLLGTFMTMADTSDHAQKINEPGGGN
jgi:uncharacterized protein (TIGR00369 family)